MSGPHNDRSVGDHQANDHPRQMLDERSTAPLQQEKDPPRDAVLGTQVRRDGGLPARFENRITQEKDPSQDPSQVQHFFPGV